MTVTPGSVRRRDLGVAGPVRPVTVAATGLVSRCVSGSTRTTRPQIAHQAVTVCQVLSRTAGSVRAAGVSQVGGWGTGVGGRGGFHGDDDCGRLRRRGRRQTKRFRRGGRLVLGACAAWSLITAAAHDGRPEGVLLAVLAVAAGYAAGRISRGAAAGRRALRRRAGGPRAWPWPPPAGSGPELAAPLGHAGRHRRPADVVGRVPRAAPPGPPRYRPCASSCACWPRDRGGRGRCSARSAGS